MDGIIIVGGGAAGLMAGIGAASQIYTQSGKLPTKGQITIIEKMPRPARKMMITGKGRCNFTNVKVWSEFSEHIYPKANFIKPAFFNLNSEKIVNNFEEWGLPTVIERGDRAYPQSYRASDVIDLLVNRNKELGVEIICDSTIEEINYIDKMFHLINTKGKKFDAKKLIICTGGLSYPTTGCTGEGYLWAKSLGHSLSTCFPSLTALVPRNYKIEIDRKDRKKGKDGKDGKGHIERSCPLSEVGEALKGIQLKNVGVELIIDEQVVRSEFGDIDFTDGGIEGPIGFKLSRRAVKSIINGSKVKLNIDLKPAVSLEDVDKRIISLWDEISKDRRNAKLNERTKLRVLFGKVAPLSLFTGFMKYHPNVKHYSLAKSLKEWTIEIAGYVGYERCVITAGGISTSEIVGKTMESKLIPGLYFAGELIDMDADTGGYNLQLAFSSGYLAGENAAKE